MGSDSLSWFALGAALTVAGLLLAVLVWRRRGAGAGLRTTGWALVPVAAALTGVLRLLADIADALARWATRLVFSPAVWLGMVVAGVAVLLWLAGTAISARSRKQAVGAGPASAPGAAAAPGPARTSAPGRRTSRKTGAVVDDDQDDIEAILRKHGIQ
jgi:hypothetical protein